MLNNKRFSEFFATVFYIGKIKYCPGTFGSLVAFPICYMIAHIPIERHIIFSRTYNFMQEVCIVYAIYLTVCFILFLFGLYFTSIYLKYSVTEDPKEVVIDEVVGQMLTIILCSFSFIFVNHPKLDLYFSTGMLDFIFLFIMPFCLFRFFDIVKPWPINWLDKNIKGAIGVMIDDIAAAVFASVVYCAIGFSIVDWIK